MTDPVSHAEMIAAVRRAEKLLVNVLRTAEWLDVDQEALHAVRSALERHERLEAMVATLKANRDLDDFLDALAAFDAAGEGESDG